MINIINTNGCVYCRDTERSSNTRHQESSCNFTSASLSLIKLMMFAQLVRYLDFSNTSAIPLHRFGSGRSYSNITVDSLSIASLDDYTAPHSAVHQAPISLGDQSLAFTLKSVVTLTATVTNRGPSQGKFVVALFAQSLTSAGLLSPVRALPRVQLVAFNKVDTSVREAPPPSLFVVVYSVVWCERPHSRYQTFTICLCSFNF